MTESANQNPSTPAVVDQRGQQAQITITDALFIRDITQAKDGLIAAGMPRLTLPQLTVRLATLAIAHGLLDQINPKE